MLSYSEYGHCFESRSPLTVGCSYENGRMSFQIPPNNFLRLVAAQLNVALPPNPHLTVEAADGSIPLVSDACPSYRPGEGSSTTDLGKLHDFFDRADGFLYLGPQGWTVTIRTELTGPPPAEGYQLSLPVYMFKPEWGPAILRLLTTGQMTRISYGRDPQATAELTMRVEPCRMSREAQ